MEIEMFTTFGENFNQESFILSRWYFFKRVPYCHVQSNFFEVEIWIWKETAKTIIIIPFSLFFLWPFYGAHQKIRRPEISKCDSFPNPHRCLLAVDFRDGVYNQKRERWFQRCFIGTPRNLREDFHPIWQRFACWVAKKHPPKQQQKLRSWAMSTRSTVGIAVGLAGWSLEGPNFPRSHAPSCIDLEDSLALFFWGGCWPSKKDKYIGGFPGIISPSNVAWYFFRMESLAKETHRNISIGMIVDENWGQVTGGNAVLLHF